MGLGDLDLDAPAIIGEDPAADLAVVEPDGLSRSGTVKYFRQGTRNLARDVAGGLASFRQDRAHAFIGMEQGEAVARLQQDGQHDFRQGADGPDQDVFIVSVQVTLGVLADVGVLETGSQPGGSEPLLDFEMAPATPGILHIQMVAGMHLGQDGGTDRKDRIHGHGGFLRRFGRGHPDPGRLGDPAPDIALDLESPHPADGRQRAGAQLGAGQVGVDPASPAGSLFCPTYVMHHGPPGFGVVVGTVDPGHIHAGGHEIRDQAPIPGCLAGQGDHDPGAALTRWAAQQGVGVFFQVQAPCVYGAGQWG